MHFKDPEESCCGMTGSIIEVSKRVGCERDKIACRLRTARV